MKKVIVSICVAIILGCTYPIKEENALLDKAAIDLQRSAFWHREYYFHLLKWNNKNADSVARYERKTDSVLTVYHKQLIQYDSLSEIYNRKK